MLQLIRTHYNLFFIVGLVCSYVFFHLENFDYTDIFAPLILLGLALELRPKEGKGYAPIYLFVLGLFLTKYGSDLRFFLFLPFALSWDFLHKERRENLIYIFIKILILVGLFFYKYQQTETINWYFTYIIFTLFLSPIFFFQKDEASIASRLEDIFVLFVGWVIFDPHLNVVEPGLIGLGIILALISGRALEAAIFFLLPLWQEQSILSGVGTVLYILSIGYYLPHLALVIFLGFAFLTKPGAYEVLMPTIFFAGLFVTSVLGYEKQHWRLPWRLSTILVLVVAAVAGLLTLNYASSKIYLSEKAILISCAGLLCHFVFINYLKLPVPKVKGLELNFKPARISFKQKGFSPKQRSETSEGFAAKIFQPENLMLLFFALFGVVLCIYL